MLNFSAMYTSTMHAALLMLTRNYTETLGTLELELAATSCHIYMALQLMLLIAEYMQLVDKELDSPEVILSLFFFNLFPMKVSRNPTSLERQLRYLNHTILYLYCTSTLPIP